MTQGLSRLERESEPSARGAYKEEVEIPKTITDSIQSWGCARDVNTEGGSLALRKDREEPLKGTADFTLVKGLQGGRPSI